MSDEALLFIQLYTDEHISPLIAQTLRRRGFVAQSAIEIGMIGRSDEEHLTYAADHSMAILTFDHVDFVRLAQQWAAVQRQHAGIIISPQFGSRQMSQLLQALSQLLDTFTANELCNQVVFLQRFGAHRPRIAETRAEYEAGLVGRGTVADLMAELDE